VLGLVAAGAALSLPWAASSIPGRVDRASATPAADTRESVLTPFLLEPQVSLASDERPHALPHAGRPVRLVVPELDVDAPVVAIDAPDQILLPPSDPRTLGWWEDGAVPGAASGGALITGHTVHSGGGAFDNLETLRRGDPLRVQTAQGSIRYVVTGVTIYRKAALAQDAGKVFSQTVPGRLVLITCEDWNGSTYLSNAVVFADPV
jgi:LPXTG-site transpeptidase (sortase) family protein